MQRLRTRLFVVVCAAALAWACGSSGQKSACSVDADCDDGEACTVDRCDLEAGACTHEAKTCEAADACHEAACEPATGACVDTPKGCDDANPCTDDTCDPATGECLHPAVGCDDANACTIDGCDKDSGQCTHTASDCDDGDACTDDACDPLTGDCGHQAVDCDDGDACTADACTPGTGACTHVASGCDDGDPCTDDTCDPLDGACGHPAKDCDDGDACSTDACDPVSGACVQTPAACADDDPCTDDTCDPASGACAHAPVDCDDGEACTTDACDPVSGECVHALVACDDGIPCTVDACEPLTGACDGQPGTDGVACDDGDPSTEGDACQAGACVGTVPPVPQPATFRLTALSLEQPLVTFNGAELNELVGALLTAELARPDWDVLLHFAPFVVGDGQPAAARFGEGRCVDDGQGLPACGFTGSVAGFPAATFAAQGSCGTDPSLSAPCFDTGEAAFDLATIVPQFFSGVLPPVQGYAVGTFTGEPFAGASGTLLGFLPEAVAQQVTLSVDVQGQPVSVADLVAGIPTVDHDGVAGWWVALGFGAEVVDPCVPATCDDGNVCTVDTCDAAEAACSSVPVDDGLPCDDGDAGTAFDRCVSGACTGIAPTTWRVLSLTVEAPEVTYEGERMNELLSALLTAEASGSDWGLLFRADPFDPANPAPFSLQFGEGKCNASGTACALLPDGGTAHFDGVTYAAHGICGTNPALPSPCFLTPNGTFALDAVAPQLFPAGLPEVEGYALGTFPDGPQGGVEPGLVLAFLPTSLAEGAALSFELGGATYTAADFVKDVPTEINDGVEGWWVRLSFSAVRVDPLE